MSSIFHSQQSISIPAPAHAERALTPAPTNSPPPPYTSPVVGASPSRAPSPLPNAPMGLRLETRVFNEKAPRTDPASNSWSSAPSGSGSGTESDITSGIVSGPASGQGLVHIPLNSPALRTSAAKSPAQRSDTISMLLHLRRAVTLIRPPGKARKDLPVLAKPQTRSEKKGRRHSSASVSSETTAVGDADPPKERDLSEPYSAAPALNYPDSLPVVHVRPADLEAQLNEADRARRRTRKTIIMVVLLVIALLVLAGVVLGIYSILHQGF